MVDITYLNDNDEIVTSDIATKIIVRELDENGNLIKETFLFMDNNEVVIPEEYTEEDIEFLNSFEKDGESVFKL